MTTAIEARVLCPKCGKRHKWRAELAGRKAKCPCGAVVTMPAEMPAAEAPVVAAPTPAEPVVVEAAAEPAPNNAAAPISKPPPKQLGGLYAQALGGKTSKVQSALAQREDEVQLSPFKERNLPLLILIVGMIGHVALWQAFMREHLYALGLSLAMVAVQAIVFVPLALGAVMSVAKLMDLGLGELKPALFKLACITLGAGAVADVLFVAFMAYSDFDSWSIAVGFIIYMILVGAPLMALFELELHETAMMIALMTVPRLVLVFGAGVLAPQFFATMAN
jgi:hypothetical protein